MRPTLRAALVLAGLLAAAALSARWWLPARFAVNGPILHALFGIAPDPPSDAIWQARLRAPSGFGISRFADGLPNVRMLRFTPAGDLLASVPRAGRVVLLEADADRDGRADGVRTLLEGLDRPHGLDLHGGWLYVAEASAVLRVRFDAGARAVQGDVERLVAGLPEGGNHWTRTLGIGPDGGLYVSVGSSCNACIEEDPRRAAILRYEADGSGERIFARGLRNAVGFDWRPGTGELYATDNGRDLLGDDFPPCELNRVEQDGFYGWPFANGDRVPDPDLGAGRGQRIAASIPPVHGFRAHNAPLGIRFFSGAGLPSEYRGAALVALHGSWNRTRKDGYAVVSLHWGRDGGIEERPFLTGFERDGDVIGRPVDVAEGPDGAVYVSDDYGGAVFRVAWGETTRATGADAAAEDGDPLQGIPEPERAPLVARGERLYAALGCPACHEVASAAAGVVPRPLGGLASRYDVASLSAFFAAPTPPMPALELEPEEARALAVFLLTTRP